MSLLAPLYVAGALAVALPILFHLIRRTPEGRQEFSSLMFLAPSPPRITRRSRLSNLLLLLLRAAALTLLAVAFARPFLRRSADETLSKPLGRRVALLVDTSASMRRGDLWNQAKAQVDKALGQLTPADEAALFYFDRQVRPGMTFAEWRETPDAARRAATLRARLAEVTPTWNPTRLGDALATAADLLAETDGSARSGGASTASVGRQVVLVSDVQQGAHAEALQGHEWPQEVLLDVRPVALKQSANASLQLVHDAPGAAGEDDGGVTKGEVPADAARRLSDAGWLRVRVTNQPDSPSEQFSLVWADARGPVPGAPPLKVYVPPGRGQTVRVPWPAAGDRQADRLLLSGDDADFDNTLYVVPPTTETLRLLFVGDDAPADTKGLLYYLRSAAGDTTRQKVDLVARRPSDPPSDVDLLDAPLVVVASPVPESRAAGLRRWAEAGGTVLWVLKDASAAQSQSLATTSGSTSPEVSEAPKSNFALLARVDFEHPLFAPFADSRFGDFTKIHFWQHRRVKLGARTTARIVASFDDGDPFLIEQPLGKGRLLVATAGWHPADSQLALSTKFVPLISNLLRGGTSGEDDNAAFLVGEPVPIPQDPGPSPATRTTTVLIAPDGARSDLQATATTFTGSDQPGIYRIVRDGKETPLAVNLSPDESRTAPLAPEELEHFGARLGTRPPSDELATRHRQLQIIELENRQKLWRWGIVAVLGLLAAETALAGRLARRSLRPRDHDDVAPQDQVVTT